MVLPDVLVLLEYKDRLDRVLDLLTEVVQGFFVLKLLHLRSVADNAGSVDLRGFLVPCLGCLIRVLVELLRYQLLTDVLLVLLLKRLR